MRVKRKRALLWLACMLVFILPMLVCGTAFGLVRTGFVDPPEFSAAIGPLAISGGRAIDTSCPEPWVRCELSRLELNRRAFYALWLVYPRSMRTQQYGHLSMHIPIQP